MTGSKHPLSDPSGCRRPEHRYGGVDVVERFQELVAPRTISELDEVIYKWECGYETVIVNLHDGGSMEYRGVYHPGDGCCVGTGVCHYCGRTLFDA